jgi:hypothetical protein
MEFISDSIASRQLAASVAFIASWYIVGSPASVKNKPREYLSDGCDNRSDRCETTGLAGSGAIVLRTCELGLSDLVGQIVALLLDDHQIRLRQYSKDRQTVRPTSCAMLGHLKES